MQVYSISFLELFMCLLELPLLSLGGWRSLEPGFRAPKSKHNTLHLIKYHNCILLLLLLFVGLTIKAIALRDSFLVTSAVDPGVLRMHEVYDMCVYVSLCVCV